MDEKYFSLSDIRRDFKHLESMGWHDISYKEVLERLEYGAIEPATDVAPVFYGHWIKDEETGEIYCSECGETAVFTSGHFYSCGPFCPECGSKMKGV